MPLSGEVGQPELLRWLNRLEEERREDRAETRAQFAELRRVIESLKFVPLEAHVVEHSRIEDRIAAGDKDVRDELTELKNIHERFRSNIIRGTWVLIGAALTAATATIGLIH